MPETYSNYIDGAWTESETSDTFEVVNPADTTDVIGGFQRSSSEDAADAIEAAADAQADWAHARTGTRCVTQRDSPTDG